MKKLLAVLLSFTIMLHSAVPFAIAIEAPTAPSAPTAPTAPPQEPTPEPPPSQPSAPDAPTTPTAPTPEQPTANDDEDKANPDDTQDEKSNTAPTPTPTAQVTSTGTANTPTPTPTSSQDGNVGDTRIVTGDANNSATIISDANTNGTAGLAHQGDDRITVVNQGNGVSSDNNASASVVENINTIQNNAAAVNNDLQQQSTTGSNNSSGNVGDTYIKTGDANVSGTVITSVNTNVDGVMVSEFNVADDHRGDIILDFAQGCVAGCGTGDTKIANNGNGTHSDNLAATESTVNNATFQNNDATVGNNLILAANSGTNDASKNTGGENIIYTGDANVSANALTFANNNFSGNVVYGVVNIYGDLVGDILFPEEQITNCCGTSSSTAQNAGNGAGSTNTALLADETNTSTFQTNEAVIDNNLILNAETGDNKVNGNTTGDNRVYTGDSNAQANVVNIANNNLNGGNMWLVIINEAGKWIGKIMGAPDNSNIAASEGTVLSTNEKGEVVASNQGNGSDSTNAVSGNTTTNNTTVQNNVANIQNNLDLSANTGKNNASYNTGGDSSIVTGDANIIANMVNFVNNNIIGDSKLFVTVVNVFGSWLGDFVTPGQHKETAQVVYNHESPTPTVATQEQQTVTTSSTTQNEEENDNGEVASITTFKNQKKTARKVSQPIIPQPTFTESSSTIGNGVFETMEMVDNEVAGDATNVASIQTKVAGKKVISINLAWLILVIPGVILLVATRKVLQFALRRLPR